MPIYEYQCTDCGHRLETIQRFSDAPLTDCPQCAHAALKKLVSAPAFRLKGSGWYETDFKSGEKRNIAGGSEAAGDSAASDKPGGDKSSADQPAADKSTGEGASTKKETATTSSSGGSDNGGSTSATKAPPKSTSSD